MAQMKSDEPDTVAKRGRPKVVEDAERRLAILRAAHEAFVELGFGQTTTAVVAAKARVSKRSIYQSFANKTELFAAVIREQRGQILDLPRPPDEDLPLLETMVRLFRLDIDDDAERAREALLNLLVRESVQFPELSDYLYESGVLRSREALVEWLQAEAARGRLAVPDPLLYAGMLMDIVFGALLPRRRILHAEERARRRDDITKRLAIFLRGIEANGVS
jgi:AcrR family transcriptional regulator